MNKLMIIVLSLFLLFIPMASAQNIYDAYFYNWEIGNPQQIVTPSFFSSVSNCTNNLKVLTNSSDSLGLGYTITTEYYSPDDSIIGISTRDMTTNSTCIQQGATFTNTKLNNYLESKAIITRVGGTTHTSILTSHIECGTSVDYLNLTTGSEIMDSRGYLANYYFDFTCGIPAPPPLNFFVNEENYNECSGLEQTKLATEKHYYCCGVACVATNENLGYYAFPFTSGASGQVEYNYSLPFVPAAWEDWGYYELSDPASTFVSLSSLGKQGIMNLISDTEYVFYVEFLAPVGNLSHANINLSINVYIPDWVCGEWSDCELGQQFRTCTDPLNKVPPKIEYQGCIDLAIADVILGFEEETEIDLIKCIKFPWWGCPIIISNITGTYPANWTVINPLFHHFIQISAEAATEGTKSLKLWYIPPNYMPALTGPPGPVYSCTQSEYGSFPQIYRDENDTSFLEHNITFPSPFMTVDFDVKKCAEPVLQYEGWCGNACYQIDGNCTTEPRGNYLFRIFDPATQEILFDLNDDAVLSWSTKHIDLTNLNLQTNKTYRFIYAVNPVHRLDAYSHCVYIDNLRVSVRAAELVCEENFCIETDLYRPNLINETICVFDISYNDRSCVPADVQTQYDNLEDYCVNTTLWSWNNQTKEWFAVEENENCIQLEREKTILDVPAAAQPLLDSLEGSGYGFLAFLFTPIVISMIIALIIAGYTTYAMDSGGKGAGVTFLITFCSILGVFSILGLFPIWFIIILITLSGLGVAIFLTRD